MAPAFLWLRYKFHNIKKKQNGRRKILNILRHKDDRKTHFCTFSVIGATISTHQNHCYLYVLFSSQPQSTNFEEDLTRSLHFIGFRSGRSIFTDFSVGCCGYSLATKDANLRPVAQKTHEILTRELVSIYEVKILT